MLQTKILGHCTQCNNPIYEIKRQYPQNHPYKGLPTQLGKPLPEARCVELVLMDSNRCTVSMCEACVEDMTPQDLPTIHKTLLASWYQESNPYHRKLVGASMLSPKQFAQQRQWLISQIDNIPVGVLAVHKPETSHG